MEEYKKKKKTKTKILIVSAEPVDGLDLLSDHSQHLQSHRSLV